MNRSQDHGIRSENGTEPACHIKLRSSSNRSFYRKLGHLPKSGLNTPDIILPPIPSRHLLLSHRNSIPIHAHRCNGIPLILIKPYLQPAVMPLNPLRQTPFLHNFGRLLKFDELAADVATKKLEFPSNMGALEYFGWGACEGRQAIGRGESLVQFYGCGAKFFGGVDRRCIDRGTTLSGRG